MPYLRDTLESIERQTYPNWEVMAWDNGSADGSVGELRAWIPTRLPGRVVTDRPLGLGDCLAEMVAQSKTELCARIDADDVNMPDRLERQVAFLVAHPEIAAVGSQIDRLDDQGRLACVGGPQMARRTGLDADVVRSAGHDPAQRARQVGESALANIAVADEMIHRAAEQTPGRI